MENILVSEIQITTTHHCEDNGAVVWVERNVFHNGELVYQDRQSPAVFSKCCDRIAAVEEWLSERVYPKTEQLHDIIEARREMIKEGRIHCLTLLNLKLKVLKARLYLVLLKLKNLLLGGVAP